MSDVTRPSSPSAGPTRRSVLTAPRPRIVTAALDIARYWCAGQIIDGAPALGHAVRVALTLGRHLPDAPPELLAAVLLHDVPDYARADVVDAEVGGWCGTNTLITLWAIHDEHTAMDLYRTSPASAVRRLSRLPDGVAAALAADKTVSLRYVLTGARNAPDLAAFWATRHAFLTLVPYLRAFQAATAHRLPESLVRDLDQLVTDAEQITAAV
ncbi:hypothetical protein [Frankia sp. AvcI1]|uniref:hypothetical protein n=1 Tax=Frankia sp. AvcI1 TaxID=573496 RepID=UPI0006EC1F6C|nr:hypothetical protein [Frankia sp. AvcI1]